MMKHLKKYFPAVVAAVIVIFSTVALGIAYSSYDNGNIILLPKGEVEQAKELLDTLGFPFGTGIMRYMGKEYAYIESRAELMPIIENILSSPVCVIPLYRRYHTVLFRTIVLSGIAVCLCCGIMILMSTKRITVYVLISAVFLISSGCMYLLKVLTLTL